MGTLGVHIKHSCEKPVKQLEEVVSNVGLSPNSRNYFCVNLKYETTQYVSQQLSHRKVKIEKYSKVELCIYRIDLKCGLMVTVI